MRNFLNRLVLGVLGLSVVLGGGVGSVYAAPDTLTLTIGKTYADAGNNSAVTALRGEHVFFQMTYIDMMTAATQVQMNLNSNLTYVGYTDDGGVGAPVVAGNAVTWTGSYNVFIATIEASVNNDATLGALTQNFSYTAGATAFSDNVTVTVSAAPQITAAVTGDADADGKIDKVTLTFSEAMNAAGTQAGFTVAGYTISGASWSDSTHMVLTLTEGSSYDTDAIPQVTYASGSGNLVDNTDATAVASVLAAGLTETDGAKPVLVTSTPQSITTTSNVIVQFSEPMESVSTLAAASFAAAASETLSSNTLTYDPTADLTGGSSYNVVVTTAAEDLNGNTLAAQKTVVFNVAADPDNTAPSTCSLSINQGDLTSSSSITLTISATDSQNAVSQMLIEGDVTGAGTGSWITYATSKTVSLSTTTDGAKTVTIKFKDAAGNANTSACATDTITLDTTAPASSASPAGGAYSVNQSVTLSATDASTTTIYYTTNGAVPTTSSSVYAAPITATNGMTIKFFAKDAAGNTESTVKSESYVVDASVPTITVSSTTKAPSVGVATYLTTGQTMTVAWSGDENGTYDVQVDDDNVTCAGGTSVDSGAYASGNTVNSAVAFADLPATDGNYRVEICLTDGSANTAAQVINVVRDTVVPTGSISLNAGATYATAAAGTLAVSGSDAVGLYDMVLAGTGHSSSGTVAYASTKSITYSTEGTVTMQVTLRDKAGNSSAVLSDTIIYDATTPSLSFSPAAGSYETSPLSITITSNDSNATIYYTTDGSAPTTNSTSATGSTSLSLTLAGTLKAFVKDVAGNQSSTYTNSYTRYVSNGGGGGGGGSSTTASAYSLSTSLSDNEVTLEARGADLPNTGDYAGMFTRRTTFTRELGYGTMQLVAEQLTAAHNAEGELFTGEFSALAKKTVLPANAPTGFSRVTGVMFTAKDGTEVTFSQPLALMIPLESIPSNTGNLALYRWAPTTAQAGLMAMAGLIASEDEGVYEKVESSYDAEANALTAEIDKTGRYYVFEVSGDATDTAEPGEGSSSGEDGSSETGTAQFTDISGHWAESYIQALAEKGVVSGKGDGKFDPNAAVNRAELVKIALLAFDLDTEVTDAGKFSDVTSGAWYVNYVAAAYEAGIVKGYSDGTFRPGNEVNRAEALKMLLAAKGVDLSAYTLEDGLFADVAADAWYAPYVAYAYENGIVEGYMEERTGVTGLAVCSPGDVGTSVVALQNALTKLGYYKGEVNGEYDTTTRVAVAEYQVAKGLMESETSFGAGYFGSKTYAKMLTENISTTETVRLFKPENGITRAEVSKIALAVMGGA